MTEVRTRVENGVAVVELDNPPMNVVTLTLTRTLDGLLDELAASDEVRALVITGGGSRAFCAGSDIKEFAALIGPEGQVLERKLNLENAVYDKLAAFPKPTVAAINGHAMGGGLEMAVCCDLLVAAQTAKLGLPEIKLGVLPGSGGTFRVPRRIGVGRAKEMMLLGEPIDAATALAWGLVNRVVPAAEVLATALEIATRLANLPGKALQACKRAIDLPIVDDDVEIVRQTLQLSEQVFEGEDVQEGVRAFFAKEKPRFRHR
ncbi:MAG: enoyl-CoA hydratase/isomerase family protein [Ectothiorhodospiraceae bacterium]|nr:enoyl-CoA hydratase/isomerase family protein [Chromatiales bacterium]MCP5154670.1 enoyl-CoA hydratase/isomerase family protein [Ectothiorhodospiraceae bacterium]